MKVLLVSANEVQDPNPVFPIGMSYVAGSLDHRHEVHFADAVVDGVEGIVRITRETAPDLVGLSLRNVDTTRPDGPAMIDGYRVIVQHIRTATSAPLVLGGSAFTLFPAQYMEALGAEYGIAGEGEHLRLLVDALENGQDPADSTEGEIPGLCLPGRVTAPTSWWTGPVSHGQTCGSLVASYQRFGGMANIQTKRGCTMRCVYCTYPVVEGRRIRNRPVEDLIDEVEMLVSAGARYLFFVDSVFNLDMNHTAKMAEAMVKKGLRVPFAAYFAPFRVTQDYADLLHAAGLTHVEFGTESLCDQVLSSYGKPFTVADVFESHSALNLAGVHSAHFLLFGGPGETELTVEETLTTAKLLKRTVFFSFSTMRIYPRTPLHSIAIDEGVITADDPLFSPTFYCAPGLSLEWINDRLRRAAIEQTNIVLEDSLESDRKIVDRLRARGRTGPLWEYLIR